MAMYVKTEYDDFVCTVTVTSDTIDEIDLTAPDFRIDIVDQFDAAAAARKIAAGLDRQAAYEHIRDASEWEYPNSIVPEMTSAFDYAKLLQIHEDTLAKLKYAPTEEKEEINHQLSEIAVASAIANKDIDFCEKGIVYSYTTASGYSAIDPAGTTHPSAGIQDYMQNLNYPMLSITNNGSQNYDGSEYHSTIPSAVSGVHGVVKSDVFANADDETLIRNGMQYWVSKDKKSLTFRFIPQMKATYQFQSIIVVCALDYQNVARFEVCLLPRLITGDLQKAVKVPESAHSACTAWSAESNYGCTYPEDDPVIGSGWYAVTSFNPITKEIESSATSGEYPRPDYIFNNDTVDNNHLYVNNTPWTVSADDEYPNKTTKEEDYTPLWCIPSTAFISEELASGAYNFDWAKFKSEIYDAAALTSMPIPYNVNDCTEVSDDVPPDPVISAVTLVPTYNGSAEDVKALNRLTLNAYQIWQFIETSADKPTFSQNQVKLTLAI